MKFGLIAMVFTLLRTKYFQEHRKYMRWVMSTQGMPSE